FKTAMARGVLGKIEAMAAGEAPGPDLLGALLGMPPDQALASVDQALGQARAYGQAGMEVMLLMVRARKLGGAGDIEAGDRALNEAGEALERVEGVARRELEEFLAEAREQWARAGQGLSEAVRLHTKGIKKAKEGDSAGALECFVKSADLSRSEGDV